MTERELLEMAAKAADIDLVWTDHEAPGYYSEWRGLPQFEAWNPLTDDGDALRLAVKLNMRIVISSDIGISDVATDSVPWDGVEHTGDPFAATRRAIVRAAAEIGRNIK